jgi:hypothetical protein
VNTVSLHATDAESNLIIPLFDMVCSEAAAFMVIMILSLVLKVSRTSRYGLQLVLVALLTTIDGLIERAQSAMPAFTSSPKRASD